MLKNVRRKARKTGGVMTTVPKAARKEVKCCDVNATQNLLSTTAVVTLLNGIAEGSSFFNRIGRRITMKSICVEGHIVNSGVESGDALDYIRILLVYDRQPNGAVPSLADVITNVNQAGTGETNPFGFPNYTNLDRFRILRDYRLGMFDTGNAAGLTEANSAVVNQTEPTQRIKFFVNLKDAETRYGLTTGVIGAINSGSLLLVMAGSQAAADAPYSFRFNARLRYRDD